MVTRFNTSFKKAADRAEWPIRIGIAVPLRRPDERGFPDDSEVESLHTIEDQATAESIGRAVIVGSITTNSMREFVFHARSTEWIAAFHERLRDGTVDYEIQLIVENDPSWDVYLGFVQ